jgi:hypothetical protein
MCLNYILNNILRVYKDIDQTNWKYNIKIIFNSFIFLHKQVKIKCQHNDKHILTNYNQQARIKFQLIVAKGKI